MLALRLYRAFSIALLLTSLAAAQSIDVTGTWLATGLPSEPWTVKLKQEGGTLTGTMEQNGGLRGPVEIYEASISGNRISFKANSPDGARAFTFTGAIAGNEIELNRETRIVSNASQGGTGLFGANGAPKFTIKRSSTDVPTLSTSANAPAPTKAKPARQAIQLTPFTPTEQWQASVGAGGAWVFGFNIAGNVLTGTIQQSGVPNAPVSIAAGKVDGSTISFKVLSPDGERIITFNGRVNGNEMSVVRHITALTPGSKGGNDIYGASASLQFIANRVASPLR